jgi:hypothetical protein
VDLGYEFKSQHCCKHQDFGGVTTLSWKFAFVKLHNNSPLEFSIAQMMAGLYTRHLQTALDDTLGPAKGRKSLEMGKTSSSTDKAIVGTVDRQFLLVDSDGLAPDLTKLSVHELHYLWVLTVTVFKKGKVPRLITLLELLAVWDYAGKIWY